MPPAPQVQEQKSIDTMHFDFPPIGGSETPPPLPVSPSNQPDFPPIIEQPAKQQSFNLPPAGEQKRPSFDLNPPGFEQKPIFASSPPEQKPVPSALPEFPVRQPTIVERTVKITTERQPLPEMEVPSPPPSLRSEISPLELAKLEEQYLEKRPRIMDVEEGYVFDRHSGIKKPIFVRTDQYQVILNHFIDIKDQLKESEDIIYRLMNLDKNEDVEYNSYKQVVEDIQRKLIYVDKTLFD
jgi:hypothetical protein